MNNALIDGFLEKGASKWKEMILGGGLSGAAKDKLLKKYVNPEKMIAGLNRGSENIFQKNNVTKIRESWLGSIKNVAKGLWDPRLRALPYATHIGSPNTTHVILPKGIMYNHAPTAISNNPFPVKYKPGSSRTNRYLDALGTRHEADEARVGLKALGKQPGQPLKTWSPTGRTAHFSPEVLARESENVMLAPQAVQKRMKKVRIGFGETPALNSVGLEYGQKTLRGAQRRKAVDTLFPTGKT